MLTKQQFRILRVFKKQLFASLTFRQVKEQSRQRSNNIVQLALREFQEQGVVKASGIGNVKTYTLNLENNRTIACLNLINEFELKGKRLPREVLSEIQGRILRQTEFFILIVFGSYAKNKATGASDLDVAVIVESEQRKKEVVPLLETVKRRELRQVDYHPFTRSEFAEMLAADSENLGKQIYKNSFVYYGYEAYCRFIMAVHQA